MRVASTKSVFIVSSLSISLFLTACTSTSEKISLEKNKKVDSKAVSSKTKSSNNDFQHIHDSNPCTAAVAHSHQYQNKDHQHSYDCENTNEFVSNAHIHPVTSTRRKFRHVHPNGSVKHSHHK